MVEDRDEDLCSPFTNKRSHILNRIESQKSIELDRDEVQSNPYRITILPVSHLE